MIEWTSDTIWDQTITNLKNVAWYDFITPGELKEGHRSCKENKMSDIVYRIQQTSQ